MPAAFLSADRASPAAGALLATLLGAGGGELVAAGGTGGDPDAAEQVHGWLLARDGWGRGCRPGPRRWSLSREEHPGHRCREQDASAETQRPRAQQPAPLLLDSVLRTRPQRTRLERVV
jgi:hypothetical protein